jgi:hypothetical protein
MRKVICLPLSLLIVFFLASWSTTTAQARKPDWVETFGYSPDRPAKSYLTGFGTSAGKDSDALQVAQDNARANVSRTIVVDIKSLLHTFREEINRKYSQHLSSITQSSTALKLMGLNTETYVDNRPPTAYALAYVSKADLGRIYSDRRSKLRDEIIRIIADAQAAEQNSRNMEAATKYLSLYPLYEELQEAETILLVVGWSEGQPTPEDRLARIEDAFAELYRELGESPPSSDEEPLMSWTKVANKVDELLLQSPKTVDDVARSVLIQLSKQVGDLNGQLMITPFTYQDTKMTSRFARYFRAAFEKQMGLMRNLNWNAVSEAQDFRPKSVQITRDLAKDSGAQWLFSGTYWEQGEKIKLMATLRDVDTGKILAGADVLFDAGILESAGLSPKPENFQQALIEQKAFAEGEIVSGQLQIDVWTNKGDQNLLFTEGEIMKVYVRVNRTAYIRLLYILADGRRTLLPVDPDTSKLHDNYYIDQSRVNHAVQIPAEFECTSPFGAEMLVVIARTRPFEPLDTVELNGHYFLVADSPKDAAAKARGIRGMKLRKQKPEDIQQTEAKIVITTMEK